MYKIPTSNIVLMTFVQMVVFKSLQIFKSFKCAIFSATYCMICKCNSASVQSMPFVNIILSESKYIIEYFIFLAVLMNDYILESNIIISVISCCAVKCFLEQSKNLAETNNKPF